MDPPLQNKTASQVVAAGYDRAAEAYADLETTTAWPRMRWLHKVLNQLSPGSALLDLGCGSGNPADIEIAKQHHVTGVDVSLTQITLAQKYVPTGHFIHADVATITFPEASFDAVVSFYTLEHLPRTEHARILHNIHHWLRPDGYFLLGTEAADVQGAVSEWLGVPMFFSSFDADTLVQLIQEAGFTIHESTVEIQREGDTEIPYLWVVGQKHV
jgi:cyclopropane fatty-acyl-phospholipid synthase-like methyltransferase